MENDVTKILLVVDLFKLMINIILGLQKSAGLDRLVRQTQLIARMESIVFSPWLNQLTCKTCKYFMTNYFFLHSIISTIHF